jgi:hypothetical protein
MSTGIPVRHPICHWRTRFGGASIYYKVRVQ